MKKVFFLLSAFIAIAYSCSNDDSASNDNASQLTGTVWEFYKEIDGTSTYNFEPCERDRITFGSDSKALHQFFSPFNLDGSEVQNGNCRLVGDMDLEWQDLGNSTYIKSSTESEEGDRFTVSNNEFQIRYSDGLVEYWRKMQ